MPASSSWGAPFGEPDAAPWLMLHGARLAVRPGGRPLRRAT